MRGYIGMKKTNKKGFTLVELVIVIAVIAILAGVMIATFSNVVSKANASADLQEIKSMLDAQYYDFIAENGIPVSIYANANGEFIAFSSQSFTITLDEIPGTTVPTDGNYAYVDTASADDELKGTRTIYQLVEDKSDEGTGQNMLRISTVEISRTDANAAWSPAAGKTVPANAKVVSQYNKVATITGKKGTTFKVYLLTDTSTIEYLEREKGIDLSDSNVGYYYIEQAD